MPFGTKPTGATREGVPTEVDFDALWAQVYQPAIVAAGMIPVRADEQYGSFILHDMIACLA